MIIKFNNGTNFEYLNALETEEYYNGSSRRTLTFECAVGVISVDMLNAILSNEANTASIVLTGDPVMQEDGTTTAPQNIYDGYVLKIKCGIENKLVQLETPETPAVYEDRLVFKLGKRTYIEQALKNLGL